MLTATLGRFCDLGIRGLSTLRIGFVRTLKSASSPYRGTNEKGGYRRAGIRIPDGGYPAADFRDVTANFVILHIRVVTEIHHPDCGFPRQESDLCWQRNVCPPLSLSQPPLLQSTDLGPYLWSGLLSVCAHSFSECRATDFDNKSVKFDAEFAHFQLISIAIYTFEY